MGWVGVTEKKDPFLLGHMKFTCESVFNRRMHGLSLKLGLYCQGKGALLLVFYVGIKCNYLVETKSILTESGCNVAN